MRVTFVNPPQTKSKYKFMGVIVPPLGILYMAASIEEAGYEASIVDGSALDLTWEAFYNEIKAENPDIIAITALTPTISQALKSAEIAREAVPNAKIVLGGYHPSFNHEEVLENDAVDIVIFGEGEKTIVDLAKTIDEDGNLEDVLGIAFGDTVTPPRPIIQDLDTIPFPARHLVDKNNYTLLNISHNMATMITSRGCPAQCSFCSSASLHGKLARRRSTKNIVDEMEHLVNDRGVEIIAFMDDTFTISAKKVKSVCEEIIARDLHVIWGCTARVDSITDEMLEIMHKAGCATIFMGVESADQQTLDKVDKNITLDKVKNAFEMAKNHDVRTIASVVIGMPGDTKKTIKKTIDFVKTLKPNYALYSVATPYPGTKFYKETFEKNLIKVKDWSKYNLITPIIKTIDCSSEELTKIQTKAFIGFYLRPMYLLRQIHMDGKVLAQVIRGVLKHYIFG